MDFPDSVIDEVNVLWKNKMFCNCMSDCYSGDEAFFQTAIMVNNKFEITLNERAYYLNKNVLQFLMQVKKT